MTIAWPPAAALRRSMALLIPFGVGVALASIVGGAQAQLGIVVGATCSAAGVLTELPARVRVQFVAVVALCAGLGAWATGRAVLVALAVAAAALAQAHWVRLSSGVGPMLPVAVAIGASVPQAGPALGFAAWAGAGGLAMMVGARLAKVTTPASPVPTPLAWRHAVLVAAVSALASWLTTARGIEHGYWLVVTLAAVLRPIGAETLSRARTRSLATVAGVLVAIALVSVVPTPIALGSAAAAVILAVAWALTGDQVRQTLYLTPAIIMAASAGTASFAVALAGQRLALTLVGAAVALLLAWALARWSDRED